MWENHQLWAGLHLKSHVFMDSLGKPIIFGMVQIPSIYGYFLAIVLLLLASKCDMTLFILILSHMIPQDESFCSIGHDRVGGYRTRGMAAEERGQLSSRWHTKKKWANKNVAFCRFSLHPTKKHPKI